MENYIRDSKNDSLKDQVSLQIIAHILSELIIICKKPLQQNPTPYFTVGSEAERNAHLRDMIKFEPNVSISFSIPRGFHYNNGSRWMKQTKGITNNNIIYMNYNNKLYMNKYTL